MQIGKQCTGGESAYCTS